MNIFYFYARPLEDAHLVQTRDDNARTKFSLVYVAVSITDTRFGTVIHFGSTDSPLTHFVAGCSVIRAVLREEKYWLLPR